MFQKANNLCIAGGTFVAPVQGDVVIYGHHSTGRQTGHELLFNSISPGAFHNSAERYDAPKCHPQTRLAILEKIMNWIRDVTNPQSPRFLWIYGPAGSGKSAIAQSIAELCEREGIIIASFFFSRTVTERNNERSIISTLVYQIYLAIPEIRNFITNAVDHDPTVLSRSLDAQIRALLVEPLSFGPLQLTPKLILIDGLDECLNPRAQKCILQALAAAAAQLNNSVRFLVASRPEQTIRTSFNAPTLSRITMGIPLDETYKPDADIKTFLTSKFSEIRDDHPSGAFLPEIWPPKGAVDTLVKKSSGQFIYASTVMKFVESHHHRPSDRLKTILGISKSGDDAPFAELDAVYRHVLSNVSPYNREKVIEVLAFLILTSSAPKSVFFDGKAVFYDYLPRTVERVLRYEQGDLYIYLLDMHSIVRVPGTSTQYVEELRFYHASFSDFLLDESRSGEYFIDIGKAHAHLTICWRRYWEDRSGYLDRHQSIFIMRNLLHHCTQSTLTPTLLEEICALDLSELLENIHGVDLKGLVEWKSFYDWLKKQEFPDPTKDLLRIHISAFSRLVLTRLGRYPASLQTLLYAAITLVEHHEDLLNISTIVIEMVLKPSESEREKFQRLHKQLLYFEEPGSFSELFKTYQEYCDTSIGTQKLAVDGEAYAELAVKLAEFLIQRPRTMHTLWTDDTATDDDAYHDSPSLSSPPHLESPFAHKKRSFTFYDATSTARKTLTTILPRAARLRALGSLLQHRVFTERNKYSFAPKEQEDMARASLKYLEDHNLAKSSAKRHRGRPSMSSKASAT